MTQGSQASSVAMKFLHRVFDMKMYQHDVMFRADILRYTVDAKMERDDPQALLWPNMDGGVVSSPL